MTIYSNFRIIQSRTSLLLILSRSFVVLLSKKTEMSKFIGGLYLL